MKWAILSLFVKTKFVSVRDSWEKNEIYKFNISTLDSHNICSPFGFLASLESLTSSFLLESFGDTFIFYYNITFHSYLVFLRDKAILHKREKERSRRGGRMLGDLNTKSPPLVQFPLSPVSFFFFSPRDIPQGILSSGLPATFPHLPACPTYF